jgi:hypothetical protein
MHDPTEEDQENTAAKAASASGPDGVGDTESVDQSLDSAADTTADVGSTESLGTSESATLSKTNGHTGP